MADTNQLLLLLLTLEINNHAARSAQSKILKAAPDRDMDVTPLTREEIEGEYAEIVRILGRKAILVASLLTAEAPP